MKGEDIEIFNSESGEWVALITENPCFLDGPKNYRIKPQPRKIWINEYRDGFGVGHTSKAEAEAASSGRTVSLHEIELPPKP